MPAGLHIKGWAMKNDLLTDALIAIRAAGYEPSVANGRHKHIKVSWMDREGRRRCLVVSRTPSNRRAHHNSRSVLRRLLNRADGTRHIDGSGR
jgi:hypothetical protein